MCELLGLAFNVPVNAHVSFRGFRHRGIDNRDGWGLAWFQDGQPKIRKEPAPASTSKDALAVQLNNNILSTIFIGHVRLANRGRLSMANTHPFYRDFHGEPIVFAHNGTLQNLPRPMSFKPDGETDSEQALCILLSRMADKKSSFSDYPWIEIQLRELNQYGNMNVLFSNGVELFIYRDIKGYKGLCLTYRESPFQTVSLRDEDWSVNLLEEKKPGERGFVVATRPLTTGESWKDLVVGDLLVIREGKIVYGKPFNILSSKI